MSANCATWTSERIELLKRCFHAGLSCGQIAREIGVSRNAVIGKINRLGLSRPKESAASWSKGMPPGLRPRRLQGLGAQSIQRLNIFAQHEMLMAAFPRPQPRAEDIPIYNGRGCTLFELARGNAAGRSATRAPRTSASAGTSQSKDCPIAWGTRALHIGRSVGSAAARVHER